MLPIPPYISLRNFDGSHGKYVEQLPNTTSNADAAKYCLNNNYPGWVRRTGHDDGNAIVYILPRGSGSEVASLYERGEFQDGQRKDYDTFLLLAN
jgi:hypothetical protein